MKYKLVDRGSILVTRRKLFWMGFSVRRPSEVWARCTDWIFFAHSDHPLHSQTLIYELQLVYLYLVDLLVQQLKERESGPNQFQFDGKPH